MSDFDLPEPVEPTGLDALPDPSDVLTSDALT